MSQSLAELFQKDPEQLTKSDVAAIIETYRKARDMFTTGKKNVASRAKVGASKKLSVEDLFND